MLSSLTACSGPQSTLATRGPRAEFIAEIWWAMFAGAVLIQLLVVTLAIHAYRRRGPLTARSRRALIVGGGVLLPVGVLTALVLYSHYLGASLRDPIGGALEIEVVGHRFWWETRYPGGVATANELRLPVGRPVRLALRSEDVIHSFWIPSLAGKLDLIPGRVNRMWIQADQAGEWRGQCAEFCGSLHAHMDLRVVGLPPDEFDGWLARQRQPAKAPTSAAARRGEQAFLDHGCAACHGIRGTAADGRGGPDLTHAAERARRDLLWPPQRPRPAEWIVDSHRASPQAAAAVATLDPATVADLARYLEELR